MIPFTCVWAQVPLLSCLNFLNLPGLFGNLSAAKPATTTSTTSLFGNNSLAAAPAASTGSTLTLGGTAPSLFGNTSSPASLAAPAPSLFGTPAAAPAAAPAPKDDAVTLGGIKSDNAKSTGPKAWRNETVPEPVCKLVDEMKKFLKEQKELKDEISRFSPASIDKVKEEVEINRIQRLAFFNSTEFQI